MSIKLSPNHGLNPSLMTCFYCGEAKGVALFGRMKGDKEAPREACFDHDPCDKCKGYMAQGVILISVRDGESGDNPHRTGNWCVVRDEALRVITTESLRVDILQKRVAFLPDEVWAAIGLPKGDTDDHS